MLFKTEQELVDCFIYCYQSKNSDSSYKTEQNTIYGRTDIVLYKDNKKIAIEAKLNDISKDIPCIYVLESRWSSSVYMKYFLQLLKPLSPQKNKNTLLVKKYCNGCDLGGLCARPPPPPPPPTKVHTHT